MFGWLTGKSKKRESEPAPETRPAPLAEPPANDTPVPSVAENRLAHEGPDLEEEMSVEFAAMNVARDALWTGVGEIDPYVAAPLLNPAFLGGPRWPGLRQSFRRITRADGVGIMTSDGLADPYDDGEGPATGLGSEVYLASTVFATTEIGQLSTVWQFSTIYEVAQNIADMGIELGPQLKRYGALSMGIPGSNAPADWLDEAGGIGVLLGVGLPGVPESFSVPAGDVAVVGVVPLRPDELAFVLDQGAAGRQRLADAFRTLTAAQLASPERPSVLLA